MAKEPKYIKPHAGFQEKFVRTNVDVCFAGGVLNPQPLDSLVATPTGFVRMGDLKAGDVICDTKGGTQIVNFVLDKGVQPCVEFTLSDGRKVKSALSHHWRIKDKHGRIREVSAEHIVDYMRTNEEGQRVNKTNYHIPLCLPACGDKNKELPIHPYILGLLIGDGCFSEKATYAILTTADQEIVDKVKELGYRIDKIEHRKDGLHYYIRNPEVKVALKKYGLWGKRSYEKFIPNDYKYCTAEDRISFLQGLFDADGTCSKTHQVAFGTSSMVLAKDTQELIFSIGGRCSLLYREGKTRDWGERISKCRPFYVLYPKTPDDRKLFALNRKTQYAKNDSGRIEKASTTIVSFEIKEPCEMRCINVSGEDHLYLTDNYVVTCNCGKTAGAVLMCAEPSTDSNWRGVFLRNNLGDLKSGGGILDEFKSMYRGGVTVIESGDPHVDFPSGARVDVTHIADQSRDKVRQRFKGRQYDLIYFDEMTGFSWDCFTEVCTRNRGRGKWTGKIRGTTNPDKNHWLRKFLDWYIGADGFIREDREGVVRYFYVAGENVEDVVWGDSKEETYLKCKIEIDRKLQKVNGKTGKATYEDMIQSFTFYLGRMSENTDSIGNNSGYVGAVAMAGGRNAEQLLEGNWNVSPNEALDAPIPSDVANGVFMADPQINNDRWVTCDLADTGTDNFLALAWDGFHITDILILGQTTPRENAERLEMFAAHHNVSNSHIIYDAVRGTYINDYIPEAQPFVSYRAPMGMYGRMAFNLKAECYLRLIEMMKRGGLSMEDKVASKIYEHQKLKTAITVQNEFMEECAVVRFKDMPSGKKALISKKEMNAKLGKSRSMDLLDPIAMRMLPVLEYVYGEELIKTASEDEEDKDPYYRKDRVNIYDDSVWA